MNAAITSRHDPSWRPGLGDPSVIVHGFSTPVYGARMTRGISRASSDWRPGLGEMSTAEIVARKLGIPLPQSSRRTLGQTVQPTPGEQQINQISAIASTGASATVGILIAMGTLTGPIGAAIAGVIAVAQLLVSVFHGCGETCVEATTIVNQVEPILQQNLATYLASPVHTTSLQAAAVNNFQTAWNAVVQNCQNPQLLSAGTNCVDERQQGACAYKTSPGGWQQAADGSWSYVYPGANGSGSACWNWFVGYLDPIQNDPTVVPDSAASSTAPTTTGSGTQTGASQNAPDLTPLLLIGALALGVWAVSGGL